MALLTQGILGPFSGKVGSVVGCVCTTRRFYIRSLPKHYRDARTPEQLRNREKLKLLMEMLSAAKGFVNHQMGHLAVGQTATNVATAMNFRRAFGESGGLRYGNVRLSRGSLPGLEGLAVLRDGNRVVMGWNHGPGDVRAEVGDRVSVMVYNALRKESRTLLDAARRMDRGLSMGLPTEWSGEEVHVYVGVGSAQGGDSDESQYCCLTGAKATDSAVRDEAMGSEEWTALGRERDSIFFGPQTEQSATKEVNDLGQRGDLEPPGD